MTKKEAVRDFKAYIQPDVIKQYGIKDKTALRTAWNEHTDILCKNREITQRQYDTWLSPVTD